ncbi:acyl-CoA dehydrogenase family protein [Neoaquamicrobium sediminum]|uniref:acyl-CoA dehydrogenase family protein n=1 Tax=Neoaquamicrobium sediminum TaxID=1849104 RepID=UPI0019D573F8|nr:acyl-CoA dehydrogenase family protein [Mesorhizobium sediminum]
MIDYNAMSDADFRSEIRQFFETEYPEELRNLSHRPKFAEIEHWHRKLHAKGWVAPAWPAEYGGMGLNAAKLLIFYEEQQRWGSCAAATWACRWSVRSSSSSAPMLRRHTGCPAF